LKIVPKINIDFLSISRDRNGGKYKLSNGVFKNITNVQSGNDYYFYIPSNIYQIAKFNLSYDSMNPNSFSYEYIYEYSNSFFTTNSHSKSV
jgi:hypothetical protein